MASIRKSGTQSTNQKKSLSHADLATLREFVNKRLAEPPAFQNPDTPTLSDLIEQKAGCLSRRGRSP